MSSLVWTIPLVIALLAAVPLAFFSAATAREALRLRDEVRLASQLRPVLLEVRAEGRRLRAHASTLRQH